MDALEAEYGRVQQDYDNAAKRFGEDPTKVPSGDFFGLVSVRRLWALGFTVGLFVRVRTIYSSASSCLSCLAASVAAVPPACPPACPPASGSVVCSGSVRCRWSFEISGLPGAAVGAGVCYL